MVLLLLRNDGKEFAVPICSSLLFCLALMVVREGWWNVLVVAADGDALVVAGAVA